MADVDGIVETFFWTPPSGNIPPVTITISSTVTPTREAKITEVPKESIKPPKQITQTPQQPGESPSTPVETPRIPVKASRSSQSSQSSQSPQSSQSAQSAQEAPQPSRTPSQITPQEAPLQEASLTTPPTAPTSSVNVALPSTRTGSPASAGSPFSTLVTLTNPWLKTPTAQITSASTAAAAPKSHTNKSLVIGLCSGGVALIIAFLAVVLFMRYRRNQVIYRRKAIKSQIGNPVAPPPPPSRPPPPLCSTRVREMAPIVPIPLRMHTHTPTRAVSSVYDDQDLHLRDTLRSSSGAPYEWEAPYEWASLDDGLFDPPPQPLQPRPSRNLTSASRRSSLLSDYRPRMDDERGSWLGGLDTVGEGRFEEDSLWEARRRVFET